MRRFCLLTSGRAASTSLMQALAAHADIGVPEKQLKCPNNEIYSFMRADRYWAAYTLLAGFPVHDELSLAAAFYASNQTMPFAGFKTMPNRHRHLQRMINEHDIQVITLVRRDIASTIASFIAATDSGVWVRAGETQTHRFHFGREHERRVDSHLSYLVQCLRLFTQIPGVIALDFETLCDKTFSDTKLDGYFKRPIHLTSPLTPIDGSHYVENWPSFTRYIQQRSEAFNRQYPRD